MRSLRTPAIALVLLAVLGLAGSACSSVQSPAMTVDGRVFSQDDLFASLAKSNPAGKVKGEYATEVIASELTSKVLEDIISSGLTQLGVSVTSDDQAQAEQLIQQSSSTIDPDMASAQVALARHLGQQAIDKGEADVDAVARQIYDSRKGQLGTPEQNCIAVVINVPGGLDANGGPVTESPTPAQVDEAKAKAEAAKKAIDGGLAFEQAQAQFSDVPAQQSTACVTADQVSDALNQVIAGLQPGQVAAPVYLADQGAVFLIKLTSRTPAKEAPAFEDEADTYRKVAVLQIGGQALQTWIEGQFRTVDVVVNPRYGTWDGAKGQVVPPAGAAVPTTPTTDLSQLLGSGGLTPADPSATEPASSGAASSR